MVRPASAVAVAVTGPAFGEPVGAGAEVGLGMRTGAEVVAVVAG